MTADHPFEFDGEKFHITVSLGVSCLTSEPQVGLEEFMRRADTALYEAKRTGRNRVCYSNPPAK
jgi:diguanylate cyclase (GGDEF)-like protein